MNDGAPDARRLDELADQVLGEMPEDLGRLDDPEYLDLALAAAAADLASGEHRDDALPERLRARLAARVGAWPPRRPSPPTARWVAWTGWVAAAACLMVAALAWRGELFPASTSARVERELAEMRASVRPVVLTASGHPLATGATGEMLWSGPGQRGFLTVRGLAEVDPSRGAYQLWIFDAERDARYPVDGGVFTVAQAERPTLVPIRPTLVVRKPSLFAVTLEPPGGVVVSDRKRIMLTGSP